MTNAEIDALIEEHIFGWTAAHKDPQLRWGNAPMWRKGDVWRSAYNIPRYSENIAEAWKVVEQLFERQGFALVWDGLREWTASFALGDGQAATVPLAICIAALHSVGVTVEV